MPSVETCVDNTAKLRPQDFSWHYDHVYATQNERRRGQNGLYNTAKYMHGAAGIGLGTTVKYLRRKPSGAAGNGLCTPIKYLRRTTSVAANNGLSATITLPCSVAAFVVNSESHTGARPSIFLCVGPELARCVHLHSG
jgi:hypothetical protein